MNLFLKKLKSVKGVSLIELIVSVALFSVLILSATGIFKMVIDGQRSSISAQNVQENMRYAMEKMSKEIRMAQVSNQDCGSGATNKVFNTANGGEELYFKNQNGDCITYYLENNRLKVIAGADAATGFVTPAKIEVSNLKFYVNDDLIGDSPSVQPYVVMVMDVRAIGQAIHEQKMKIQMTISSRAYEGGDLGTTCTPDCTGAVCGDSDGCEGICDGSCATGTCVDGVCTDSSWLAGPCLTSNSIYVYATDLSASSWGPAGFCTSPQCATGLDPAYSTSNALVASNAENFISYPARNACKTLGGRLPTVTELSCIYTHKADYGTFQSGDYWSNVEATSGNARFVRLTDGFVNVRGKSNDNYVRCVQGRQCTGADPENSTICAGDDTGLSTDTPKTLVSSCTVPTKCEYNCDLGYIYNAGNCVSDSSYVKLLLHMNGADGSTIFTDSETTPKTITRLGNAQIDTAYYKFPTASGLFDGSGDYLTVSDSNDWYFGTGDFTIDFWVRGAGAGTTLQGFCGQYSAGNYWYLTGYLESFMSEFKVFYFKVVTSGITIIDAMIPYDNINPSSFNHIELTRSGSNIYLFVNGFTFGPTNIGNGAMPNSTGVFEIGATNNHATVINGWIDEFRITKGAARHTTNFTPPTTPAP